MSFGVSGAGFAPKRLADIQAEIEAKFQAEFGTNVRLDADSPNGQLIGIMAEREALVWEIIEQAYAAPYVLGASGVGLDRLLKLVNVTRRPATKTAVNATLSGTPGTVIGAGAQAAVADTGALFELVADATIGGGGTVVAATTALVTGPTQALTATLTVIKTPVSGWASVTNAADGVVGQDVESDDALRQRQANLTASVAGSSAPALYGTLVRVAGVLEVVLIENRSSLPDADGRPGHSIEAVVRGGVDQTILQAIWNAGPAGIETLGSTSGSVTDSNGDAQTVKFSRPTDRNAWIGVTLKTDAHYPVDGDAQLLAAILAAQAGLTIGKAVVPFQIVQSIEIPGILTLVLTAGLTSTPVETGPVAVGKTERALLDSARVSITHL